MDLKFNMNYVVDILRDILAIDSPTGFTDKMIKQLKKITDDLGFESNLTNKGNFILYKKGRTDKTIGVAAHMDTLGLMVRSINEDGSLMFIPTGGASLPTLDGEYCKIYTREGNIYTGTILSKSPAKHVFTDADTLPRNEANMYVRIDEKVSSRAETQELGIMAGDYICYDTKTVITNNGFIKSRFLDDKLSVALVLGVLYYIKENKIGLAPNLYVLFSSYEEVGHGLSAIPQNISEMLAIDMGCIGRDLTCTEYDVSICAKDTSGPYDYELTSRLIHLAKEQGLNFAVDVYPQYASDVSAALKGGNDIKGALIGPGVHASHGMERSHLDAVENTMKLLYLYLSSQ